MKARKIYYDRIEYVSNKKGQVLLSVIFKDKNNKYTWIPRWSDLIYIFSQACVVERRNQLSRKDMKTYIDYLKELRTTIDEQIQLFELKYFNFGNDIKCFNNLRNTSFKIKRAIVNLYNKGKYKICNEHILISKRDILRHTAVRSEDIAQFVKLHDEFSFHIDGRKIYLKLKKSYIKRITFEVLPYI